MKKISQISGRKVHGRLVIRDEEVHD